MANKLGSYQLSEYEYAENVFNFVKNNIKLAFVGIDREVNTLKRGAGTCMHQLSLLTALCRAGGLKARYKLYSLALIQSMYDNQIQSSPILKGWYDALGSFMLHGTSEVQVDGEWLTADPTFTPHYEAAMGIPLAKFGEDPMGMWNYPIEGTTMLLEGFPIGAGGAWNLLVNHIARGERYKVDRSIQEARANGKKILEEMTIDGYDTTKREKYEAKLPKVTLDKCKNLVFK
jgi:hypothetical protein